MAAPSHRDAAAVRAQEGGAPRVFVLGNYVQACCWSVPRIPVEGETLAASGLQVEPGGKGLNVAVGLARLGCHVDVMIGCGQDAAADELLQLLRREGIATAHVHRLPGRSGWGAGLITPDGRNAIAVYLGANELLTAAHARSAAADIAGARLVYGQFETALPAVEAAFALARDCGVPAVLNPSPWREPGGVVRHCTSVVIANEVEALRLLDLPAPLPPGGQAAAALVAGATRFWAAWPLCRTLVVTLGPHGAIALERAQPGQPVVAQAVPVDAVDTVGAGDAFAAGLCHALAAGMPLPLALAQANACGARVAASRGVLGALPTAGELQTFSRSR